MHTPRIRKLLAVMAAAAMLGVSWSCAASAPTDSGVSGLVTIGPTSPVQHEGEPGDVPYSATLVIRDAGGAKVAEVTSGADGRFIVTLPPGAYVLEPQSPGVMPYAQPLEMTVEAHRFTEVTVQYDSGIR